jgi:hypothetical protein
VQPTDFRVRSVFVSNGHGGREEERAWRRIVCSRAGRTRSQEGIQMRSRLAQVLTVLGSVAALALAGGASLRGF